MRTMVATDGEGLAGNRLIRTWRGCLSLGTSDIPFGLRVQLWCRQIQEATPGRRPSRPLGCSVQPKTKHLVSPSYQDVSEPCLISRSRSDSDNSSLQHLRLGLLWDDNASGGLGQGLCTLDENAIEQGDQSLCNSGLKLRNKKLFHNLRPISQAFFSETARFS